MKLSEPLLHVFYAQTRRGMTVPKRSKNIQTTSPWEDLEDKQFGPFRIARQAGSAYWLQLPTSMKMHNVFSSRYLRPCSTNPLPGQIQESPRPTSVKGQDQWVVNDIIDSRRDYGRLQYKVKWEDVDRTTNGTMPTRVNSMKHRKYWTRSTNDIQKRHAELIRLNLGNSVFE